MPFWLMKASIATADLPVWRSPDDQLALAAADRHQRVDGLEARLHRLVHRFARNDARRLGLDLAALGGIDRALAVDRIAEPIDDAAEQALADRNVDDGLGALDRRSFDDVGVRTEDHDADIVGFEVQRHALHAAVELDHLARLDVVEPVDAGDAVADRQHGADLGDLSFGTETGDLVLDYLGNFCGVDIHCQPFMALARELSLVRSEPSIIRLPMRTTSPPSSEGSTLLSTLTSRPARLLSLALSAAI